MIRLIVETHEADFNSGINRKEYSTVDVDIPELEHMLSQGGRGEMGFMICRLLGAEVFCVGKAKEK